jgi:hypothetical protein
MRLQDLFFSGLKHLLPESIEFNDEIKLIEKAVLRSLDTKSDLTKTLNKIRLRVGGYVISTEKLPEDKPHSYFFVDLQKLKKTGRDSQFVFFVKRYK